MRVSVLLFFLMTFSANAQITTGTITYDVITSKNRFANADDPSHYETMSYQFGFQFNEKYNTYFTLGDYVLGMSVYSPDRNVIMIYWPDSLQSRVEYFSTIEENDPYEDLEEFYKKPDTSVIQMSDTKNILGYTCKRTVLDITNGTSIELWCTDEIKTRSAMAQLPDEITGTILELTIFDKSGETRQIATSVTPGLQERIASLVPPPTTVFELPAMYVWNGEVSYEDRTFPDFITYPTYTRDWNKLNEFVEKADKKQSPHNEYFTIELNERGEVVSCVVTLEPGNEALGKRVEKLLRQKGAFTPVLIEGQPISCRFDVSLE